MKKELSIKKVAIINAAGKYSTIIVQILVNIVLSRILSPTEYGVVAVITTFSTFFYVLSAMGLGTAIIQIKNLNKKDIDSIFSFSVYISFILAIVFGLFSFFIAWLYKSDIYISLGWLLSISLLFNALNMVPDGIMYRDKRFIEMALRTALVYSFAGVMAIVFAKLGFGYYSLVLQSIVSAVLTFIWNYISTKPIFHFVFHKKSISKVASYSGFQMGAQVVGYFCNNMDNLLAGKLLGEKNLGFYNKAYTLANYPINNFSSIIASVLHPMLTDYQDDSKKMYSNHLKINKLFALAGGLAGTLMFLASEEIIIIMFGSKWKGSIICLKILSLSIIFRMMNSALNAFFQAFGRTDLLFKNKIFGTIIITFSVLLGALCGKTIEWMTVGVSVSYCLFYFISILQLCKSGFKIKIIRHIYDMKNEIIVNSILLISVVTYNFYLYNIWKSLIIKGIYTVVIFCIAVLIFDRKYISLVLRKGK